MNEEHSSNQTETTKKSFFQSLIGRFFQGELKNREELVEVIRDSEQNDLIDQNTREMIEGVMEIAELRVRDIMIPRSQIVFIESNQDLDACLNTIIESAHSRFPVIADTDDRDNILEQIVGDIEDEFDEEDVADIRQLSRHTYAVRALTDIDDFNAQFYTHFDDEEVDTIGGLIMQAFGYLPKRGEEITLENIQFKVTSADSRRLIQVRVTVPDEHLSDMEGVEEQAE